MSGERSEFRRMAESIASTSGTPAMLPVIEKEVLHYHILSAMRESGYLDRVVFQGGTSLRLCHGSPRYSEDLDFVGGDAFTGSDMRASAISWSAPCPQWIRISRFAYASLTMMGPW